MLKNRLVFIYKHKTLFFKLTEIKKIMGYFGDTPIKIEKVADQSSLLKTTSNQFSEKEQKDLINNLNKTKVYLLTTQNLKKKQLLLIHPESRLASEKALVNNRHQSFIKNVVGTYDKRQKNIKEKHKDRLNFNLRKLEKSTHGLRLKRFVNSSNANKQLASKTVKSFKLFQKVGRYGSQYFRNSQSYYSQEKKNLKAICPVFFDKLSAEEFLIQNSEFSSSNKTAKEQKLIIELIKNLLDLQEASKEEFLDEFSNLQQLLKSQKQVEDTTVENKQSFASSIVKKFVTEPKIESLKESTKEKIKTYEDQSIYFENTFKNYQNTFESLKRFTKDEKPKLFSKKFSPSVKEVSKTKIVSVGLGDLICSYSSFPKSDDLKYFEFLFFPKMEEKSVISVFGKKINFGKNGSGFSKKISDSQTTTKTFKSYQKEYFQKL